MAVGLCLALFMALFGSPASAQRGGVVVHSVDVSGPVAAGAVREVVRRGSAAIERCRATRVQEGAAAATIRGALRLRIYVASDGRPVASSAEASTVADEPLIECAREASMRWRFASAGAPSSVRVVLTFGGGRASELDRVEPVRPYGSDQGRETAGGARPEPLPPAESVVTVAVPIVSAGGDREGVRRVLRRRVFTLRRCYDVERARDPDLAGLLVVTYSIGSDGRVLSARADADRFSNRATVDCVLRLVRRLVFPAPEGGGTVQVEQALIFRPPPDPARR